MHKCLSLAVAALLSLALAPESRASIVEWAGTLETSLGNFGTLVTTGTGLATINGSGTTSHINTIHFGPNQISGNITLPLTDPDNATLVTLIGENVTLPVSGDLKGISGGPPLADGSMPVGGRFKVCFNFGGPFDCNIYLPFPFLNTAATAGLGVGGTLTVNTFSKGVGLKVSLEFAPWTLGLDSMKSVSTVPPPTPNGFQPPTNTNATIALSGFAHGPASGASPAAGGGVLQVVTPVRVETSQDPPNSRIGTPAILRLHFIPEPGLLLLLGAGVAGLLVLGHHRMRS